MGEDDPVASVHREFTIMNASEMRLVWCGVHLKSETCWEPLASGDTVKRQNRKPVGESKRRLRYIIVSSHIKLDVQACPPDYQAWPPNLQPGALQVKQC